MATEYTSGTIGEVCGADAAAYARNKHRGGRSNAKGRTFELIYGAVRIAELAAAEISAGGSGEAVRLADQLQCFVDDLVVFEPTNRTMAQIKSGAVSWEGGEHSLSDDFRMQREIDRRLGIVAAYELVVADRARMHSLQAQRPEDISEVCVKHLSGCELDALFANHEALPLWLDALCVRHPPRQSTREQTFLLLLAVWASSQGTVTLRDLINRASTGPDALIGPLGESGEVPDALAAALRSIPGFSFLKCDAITLRSHAMASAVTRRIIAKAKSSR